MIPNSLANNPYMNEASFNEQTRGRFSSVGSMHQRPMSMTTGTFYKQYPTTMLSTEDGAFSSVELQRLANMNSELQVRCSQLVANCKILEDENVNMTGQLHKYASTLEKMYRLHNEQQVIINKLRSHEHQTGDYSEALNRRNLQLNNEIQNLAMDRQLLAYRLNEEDVRAHREREMLGARLNEKAEETHELRKKFHSVLDVKTKLEEEVSALRFALDNLRSQAALELKERSIKLDNVERSLHETLTAKNQQIRHLSDRLRAAEQEARKLRESNTLLLTRNDISQPHRLDNVSRIYPDSNFKLNQKSGGKQNARDVLNHGRMGTDAPVDTRFDLGGAGNPRLNELLSQKEKQLEEKESEVLGLQDRLRKLESKMSEASLSLDKRKTGHNFEGQQEIRVMNSLIQTIDTLRSGLNKLVFERFVISVNHADQRKTNSLVLFVTNMNEFVHKQGPQIKHSIDGYYEARNGLKEHLSKQHLPPNMREKLTVAVGKLVKYENDFRDKVNKWIEGTLMYTIDQRRLDSAEKNKELMFLFRLLTIKYRILYPIRGKSFTIDADLSAVLEHKVVSAVRDYLKLKMLQ